MSEYDKVENAPVAEDPEVVATRRERKRCAAICRALKPWGNTADDWAADRLEQAALKIESGATC